MEEGAFAACVFAVAWALVDIVQDQPLSTTAGAYTWLRGPRYVDAELNWRARFCFPPFCRRPLFLGRSKHILASNRGVCCFRCTAEHFKIVVKSRLVA